MSFAIDWRSWLFGIEVGEGEDFWRRKCDRLRGEMGTRLREDRSLSAALAVVLAHVKANRIDLDAVSEAFRLSWGAADHNAQKDALVALLEALAEHEK